MTSKPHVVGSDSERDTEEPRTKWAARIVKLEAAVDDDEDILRDVRELSMRNTETSQGVPHVGELAVIDLRKIVAPKAARALA